MGEWRVTQKRRKASSRKEENQKKCASLSCLLLQKLEHSLVGNPLRIQVESSSEVSSGPLEWAFIS